MKKILIVDDEPDIMKVTEFRVKKAGYATVAAADGKTGLEKARSERPDLILLDYRLPDMNGVEVFRNLRQDDRLKKIPVIFFTASRENESVLEEIRKAGGGNMLTKPYEPAALLARIKELVG